MFARAGRRARTGASSSSIPNTADSRSSAMRLPAAGRARETAPVVADLSSSAWSTWRSDRGNVLAHLGRVRARAVELKLTRLREQPVLRVSQRRQNVVGQLTAQQAHERADPAGAASDDAAPARLRHRGDADRHAVQLAARHVCLDPAPGNRQVQHGAVAQIGAPARQAVGEVGVPLEVVGPGLAPERDRELPLAVRDHDRLGRPLALPQQLRQRPGAVRLLVRH